MENEQTDEHDDNDELKQYRAKTTDYALAAFFMAVIVGVLIKAFM